jgi:hypothetical protein
MTKDDIEAVFDRVRSWPEALQKEAVSILLALEQMGDDEALYELSEEDLAAIDEAEASPDASEEEVTQLYKLAGR